MRTTRIRWAVACAAVLLAALVPLLSGTTRSSDHGAKAAAGQEFPPALAAHLSDLAKAIPGNGGEPDGEGPAGADVAKLQELAYPAPDIPLGWLSNSRSAFSNAQGRHFPRKGKEGVWSTVGPDKALYPFFDLRDLSLYVPNAYVAASRINAMAIDPNCRQGRCTMWIGPAGGGIWRTSNALAPSPKWTYLSGSFAINSIGSIALDPRDPTATRSGSARVRRTRAAAAACTGRASTSRPTAATTGPARSDRACSAAAASARSRSTRATRRRCTCRRPSRCTATRPCAAPASPGWSSPGPGCGASTSRPTAGRTGRTSTAARRTRRTAPTPIRHSSRPTPVRARRAASGRSCSTRRTRTSSTRRRTREASGDRPTRA